MAASAVSIGFSGCSGISLKPGPARASAPVLERGWSYVESERDFLEMESGVDQVSYSGPALVGEKLVYGSDRFGVTVLARHSGQVLWRRPLGDGIAAQPLVDENSVYVGSGGGELLRLELGSGRELWRVPLSGPVQGSMILAHQRLFVGTEDEALHALDPATGKLLWSYRRPPFNSTKIKGGGNPAAIAGRIWVGFSDGALVALDPETGTVDTERVYRDGLKFTDLDARVVGWKEGLLVATYDGKLRHTRRDGSLIWEFPAGGARAPIVAEGETVFLPSSDGTVYSIGSKGQEIWRWPLRRGVPTGVTLIQRNGVSALVVATSESKIFVLRASDGALLGEANLGRGTGSLAPVVADDKTGTVYVLSLFSRIHQFRVNL